MEQPQRLSLGLPFNWSGDAKLWVIADADSYRDSNAEAITVDATFDYTAFYPLLRKKISGAVKRRVNLRRRSGAWIIVGIRDLN